MKIPAKKRELIGKIESIIGNNCFNGHIQNWGPGGVYEGSGRYYVYPITFQRQDGSKLKKKHDRRASDLSDDEYLTGHYAFGANKLAINRAIAEVVEMLERNLGLKLD